ncbi:AAA family ATPase [Bradyrhizobium sp. NBAIM03]|uniref:AAA domain-containing protein n=1 Tax=Bradyrhizobium sp. NBAIM03 TaxID=2793816 RepID=UPI001CD7E798|nr:AAA domain-containing protein [Bradyrhizobium sp. NBAIM03]MCA1534780.1 AAA family ATPase [Bradyrhizobium sp. NBAIM03]
MARGPKLGKATLDARFTFADTAFSSGVDGWHSQLRFATGIADGEDYLLRLFKKTGSALDEDLKRLITHGLRRVRRILSSRRARQLLVEVLEIVEDQDEIGILMVDPGSPISGSLHRVRAREGRLLTTAGRKVFWRNILRVAEGLALCHDAGIVHGAISEHAIFSHSDEKEDFRLGGYEACVHIADGDMGGAGHLLRPSGTVSFRQDWSDLGQTASRILGLTEDGGGPSLLPIERRMLNRLANPPHHQLFDGNIVLSELTEIVADLERSGSSAEGELVLYPSPQVIQSDLPALTSGTIQADDRDAVLRFVEDDLSGPTVRTVAVDQAFVRVITDLAAYGVKVVDDCVGMIENANKRRPDDHIFDAVEVSHRVYLARTRKSAEERVRKLGPGAKQWIDASGNSRAAQRPDDIPTWYALILLEAFTWLREQFRIYPVEVLHPPSDGDTDLAWIACREDDERDIRRKMMGLRPAYDALGHELRYDDGKPNWTLSRLDALAGDRERLPELSYEGTGGIVEGRLTYTFATSEAVVPGQTLYLRPRRDSGFERAIRRRLQNIVAARTNIELLRAIDDPAQVALDDALRDIAAPGSTPPDDMDASKKSAWDAIVAGRSINVVIGPPGVGKTFLISHLVKSILGKTRDARLLVSAQNHETLIQMEDELKKTLAGGPEIVVRVDRTRPTDEVTSLRTSSIGLLQSVSVAGHAAEAAMVNQRHQIKQALRPVDPSETVVADRVFRDTENLLLRSSDVTLATTSSHIIEEMIADGDQFDWVIVEEAARANGAELIGALLLGNRRIVVGDHNQLSPFDAAQRQKFYDAERASELLRGAKEQLETISDLPPEVNEALDTIKSNELLLKEVLATAARLEEPFRSIAEREEQREKDSRRPSTIVNTLLEQSRMHPAIGDLVSNTFYNRRLVPSDRVKRRALTVTSTAPHLAAPIVLLDFPPLSVTKRRNFETKVKRSYRNDLEAQLLIAALKGLQAVVGGDGRRPTLVILSPYLAQVNWFKHLLNQRIKKDKTLFGFASPRSNGEFIFTSDSFQGGEADVVAASLTRNNVMVGSRALGFVKSPQRMNVLLSRAKQKLVLATSQDFIRDVVDGIDPDGNKDELEFLRKMLKEFATLAGTDYDLIRKDGTTGKVKGASIITVDENGRFPA